MAEHVTDDKPGATISLSTHSSSTSPSHLPSLALLLSLIWYLQAQVSFNSQLTYFQACQLATQHISTLRLIHATPLIAKFQFDAQGIAQSTTPPFARPCHIVVIQENLAQSLDQLFSSNIGGPRHHSCSSVFLCITLAPRACRDCQPWVIPTFTYYPHAL